MRGRFDELPAEAPFEGVSRRTFDSAGATVASYDFEPGARFPIHRHPEEQITVVLSGQIECTAGGERMQLAPGEWAVFASNVEHGMTAGPDGARFLAVIVPRRPATGAYTVVDQE